MTTNITIRDWPKAAPDVDLARLGRRRRSGVSISSDNVFGDNTAAQIAQQTPALTGSVAAGYTGTILIGVGA